VEWFVFITRSRIVFGEIMSTPRFSIVIPTRNRSRTLYYSLQTCLAQNFASFEIVVCDNCSSPETKQVVDSLESDRINYIRSDISLAMSDNWELALSHAQGEYVIVIGDDDGLLPNALTDLDHFIAVTGAKAIRWAVATYMWPDVEGVLAANKIHIPTPTQTILIDSHQVIQSVIEGKKDYSFLPMLYYSAIHRELIQDLKNRTGRIFKGSCPDVYTAFTVGYISKTHYLLGKPLSIVGFSGKSNGVATLLVKEETLVAKEFNQLNESAGQVLHAQIPNLPVMAAVVANEFLNAKQALFPGENQFSLDRKKMIINCINDLENFNRVGNTEWGLFMDIIADSLSDDENLKSWFEQTFMRNYEPQGKPWIFSQAAWRDGLTAYSLFLDGGAFGVSDVFGAAQLCGKLISQNILFTDVVDQPELPDIPNLHQELIDKEQVIQKFHQELLEKEQVINAFRTSTNFWFANGPLARFRLF
jgi:glycosyltransferase involved in cell wall biosynthesis